MKRTYYVYIMTNKINNVLYAGITNNLLGRVWQHKHKVIEGFTSKYNIKKLVYYEEFTNPYDAIMREKQIKAGSRKKKDELISNVNKGWKDLSKSWYY